MSDQHPTPEEVRASIIPKSDQLNADDLITPITVTVTKVRSGDKEQPLIVEIEGYRPYKPCKTMRRILIATWTDDSALWVGQQMTLYRDPDVLWGGVKVGGIRISHLSGLAKPKTYIVTQSRRKREEVLISPINATPPPPAQSGEHAEEKHPPKKVPKRAEVEKWYNKSRDDKDRLTALWKYLEEHEPPLSGDAMNFWRETIAKRIGELSPTTVKEPAATEPTGPPH